MRLQKSTHPPHVIRAYVFKHHELTTLDRIHDRFALGSSARFHAELAELFIHDEERFYGKKAEDIRKALDSEGYEEDFVVVEDNYDETQAAWYVGRYKEYYEDEDEGPLPPGYGPDNAPLLKMRTIVEDIAMLWTNYDIGNMSLEEDIDMYPYDPEAPQEVHEIGFDYEAGDALNDAYIVAEAGEYETGPWSNGDISYPPDREPPEFTYRLKEDVARENGLVPKWTLGWSPEDENPGTMAFSQSYLLDSPVWKKPYVPLQH